MDTNYEVITLFQHTFILRRPRVFIIADIIKIKTFIDFFFKDSRKVKRIITAKFHHCRICVTDCREAGP